MSSDTEDNFSGLGPEAIKALMELSAEQTEREVKRKALRSEDGSLNIADTDCNKIIEEDWQLSQFWYCEETAKKLAREADRVVGDDGLIACVSCPTTYIAIKKYFPQKPNVVLLEYDKRFADVAEGDFVFYDYKSPTDLPKEFRERFSLVIADPPFLSDECITKTAVTIKYLAKDKIILCTGTKMSEMCDRLLKLKPRKFVPKHNNNLANEFGCFSNYEDIDNHLL